MSLGRLLRKRRNVYGFADKPIPRRILTDVLEDARHVPSAGFTQDFDFIVVKSMIVKKRLADAAYEREYLQVGHAKTKFITNAPVVIIPCANKTRFEAKYGTPAEKNARLPWWLIDAGFASLVLILSAFEKGLAASFIGAFDEHKAVEALRLPSDGSIVPLAIVPMGFKTQSESSEWRKKKDIIIKRRRRLEDYLHWDRW